jgi:hypothetical protein
VKGTLARLRSATSSAAPQRWRRDAENCDGRASPFPPGNGGHDMLAYLLYHVRLSHQSRSGNGGARSRASPDFKPSTGARKDRRPECARNKEGKINNEAHSWHGYQPARGFARHAGIWRPRRGAPSCYRRRRVSVRWSGGGVVEVATPTTSRSLTATSGFERTSDGAVFQSKSRPSTPPRKASCSMSPAVFVLLTHDQRSHGCCFEMLSALSDAKYTARHFPP